ncbi:MAG: hypothetical protein HRU21_11075 [Pseudomonadales bacterium]|nr:hypothetical protein [Pseudomonadales bacterium]
MSEPIIKMDAEGKASVISYNVPEPTSYSGRNIIELEFDDDIFNQAAKQIPAGRKTPPSAEALNTALDNAREFGVIDTRVLPNIGHIGIRSPAFTERR